MWLRGRHNISDRRETRNGSRQHFSTSVCSCGRSHRVERAAWLVRTLRPPDTGGLPERGYRNHSSTRDVACCCSRIECKAPADVVASLRPRRQPSRLYGRNGGAVEQYSRRTLLHRLQSPSSGRPTWG